MADCTDLVELATQIQKVRIGASNMCSKLAIVLGNTLDLTLFCRRLCADRKIFRYLSTQYIFRPIPFKFGGYMYLGKSWLQNIVGLFTCIMN